MNDPVVDKIKTRYGEFLPCSDASDLRKKYRCTVEHHKNGNLKSVKTSYNLLKYDNKYDKQKNLIKRVTGISGNKQTCTFKYKKIKVDKKYAKQIKEQQYALLNSDAQLVFPVYF